jgi:uncharacterized protein YdeI (YjbR/CyaY-like superfamily)
MRPRFFRTQTAFRSWLDTNHAHADELLVGFWRKGSGKGGINYSQALDEALCFGWIDGVRRNVDAESYSIRFTPRRRGSIWSNVNIAHFKRLQAAGLVRPAGLAEYEKRSDARSGAYSFENAPRELDAAATRRFRANKKAWAFWEKQPPGYRRLWSWWAMSAKKDETRERRLAAVIAASAKGLRLDALESPYTAAAGGKREVGNGK